MWDLGSGIKLMSLHRQVYSLPLSHHRNPEYNIFNQVTQLNKIHHRLAISYTEQSLKENQWVCLYISEHCQWFRNFTILSTYLANKNECIYSHVSINLKIWLCHLYSQENMYFYWSYNSKLYFFSAHSLEFCDRNLIVD